MQQTRTIKISREEAAELLKKLLSCGFSQLPNTNEYFLWRVEGDDLSVLMYTSGSLVIQGIGDAGAILSLLNIKTEDFSPHMGSDEVGKGDYFGPLVVACAYVGNNNIDIVKRLGAADSKSLSDSNILKIFEQTKGVIRYEVSVVSPSEYNGGVKKFRNISYFLANIHRKTAEKLIQRLSEEDIRPEYIVIDQFSTNKGRLENEFKDLNITLKQFHKGESDIVVALASIIARAVFLNEMQRMSQEYSFEFPKGAVHVIRAGREFVKKYGIEKLNEVAKVSFKTTQQVTSLF